MTQQMADFFNRFYLTVLKQQINDPVIHSEWMYFLSMFKGENIEKDRIQLYLGILNNQKKKKNDKHRESIGSNSNGSDIVKYRPENKLKLVNSGENYAQISDLKLEKRMSENWKTNFNNNQSKIGQESLNLKKLSSLDDGQNKFVPKYQQQEVKSMRLNNEPLYALATNPAPNCYAYIKPKSANEHALDYRQNKLKEKHSKLCEISKKLMGIFQTNTRLRV